MNIFFADYNNKLNFAPLKIEHHLKHVDFQHISINIE